MGSYALVSHQSQACSCHCTESCSTTRSPWLGMMMCSPRVRRSTSTTATSTAKKYMKPHLLRTCQEVANAPRGGIGVNKKELLPDKVVGVSIVKRFETGMQQVKAL